jgi:hypothetical protein
VRFRPILSDDGKAALPLASLVGIVFILLGLPILAAPRRGPERDLPMACAAADVAPAAAEADFPPVIAIQLRRSETGVAIRVGPLRLPDNDFRAIRSKLAEINMPAIGVQILADPSLSVEQVTRALDEVLSSPMKRVTVASLSTGKAKSLSQ